MGKIKKIVVIAACLLVVAAVGGFFAVSQCEREASNVSTSESEVGAIVGKPRVVKIESASAPIKETSDEEAAEEEDVVPALEQEAATTSSGGLDGAGPSAAMPVAPSAPHPDDGPTPEELPRRWIVDYEQVWVEDSPAWDEQVPITSHVEESVCNICGAVITGNEAAHGKAHMLAGEGSGHHTEYVETIVGYDAVHHDATGHWEAVEDGGHWE